MKNFIVILFCTALSGSLLAQIAKPITLKELLKKINRTSDSIQVYNFWATWCGPCIKELPVFEKAWQEKKAHVILVSLDYELDSDVDKVNRFIAKKGLRSPVYFLTASNPNRWIDQIDKRWSGSLPATLIVYPQGRREFHEGIMHAGKLEQLLKLK